ALDVAIEPAEARVGEPLDVNVTVSGLGNVALWPEPAIHWPAGFRTYPGEATVRVESKGGQIGGSKTFHYFAVPDSVGAFLLPEVRYAYYDRPSGDATVARAAPRALAVGQGAEPRAARPLPPLDRSAREAWTTALAAGLLPWGWLVLLLGPPLGAWLWRRRAASHPDMAPDAEPDAAPLSRLGRLEHAFQALLVSHVPDPVARDGDGLARALRAAGVESAVADHVMRLRDRLRAARYGPRGLGDGVELAAELAQVLKVLGVEPPGGRRRRLLVTLCLAGLASPAAVPAAAAQGPSAEALYEVGALRAAADSFAARAAAEPRVAAHWYNLGATLYRAGADGKASAAWAIAARLAPRDETVRRARELLPPPDAPSEPLFVVGFATPGEWALVAAVLWGAMWMVAAGGRRRVVLATVALATAATAGLAAREALRRGQPVAIVVHPATSVRVAPYGSASAAATVEAGAAL